MRLTVLAFITLLFSLSSFAQTNAADPAAENASNSAKASAKASESSKSDIQPIDDDAKDFVEGAGAYRTKQYVNLTMGIEQDVKLPHMPEKFEVKGDFRKVVTALFAKEVNALRLTPVKEGFATLTIHDKSNGKIVAEFKIDVKKSKLDKVVSEIRSLLGDIEGINIKVVNNKVIVDGQILLPKDMGRIYSVISQFEGQASSLVTLSPIAMKKIAEYISRDIGNPEIQVRSVNDKLILEGVAASQGDKDKAEIIAKMYLPDMVVDDAETKGVIKKRKPANDGVINLITVKEGAPAPPAKLVQLVVHFVELNKDYSKAFKFQFTPEIVDSSNAQFNVGQSAGSALVSNITGTISSLFPKLNWAKDHGYARILESSSILVEDGKKGEIKNTTQVPYTTIGKDGAQGTAFVEVGLKTSIKPVTLNDKSGSINLEMDFSLTNLLGTATGAPMTSSNNVTTTVTVRDRQDRKSVV